MDNRSESLAMLASVLLLAGGQLPDLSGKSTTRHNVTECCECGAEIGRGRDGRRCKKCRETKGVK